MRPLPTINELTTTARNHFLTELGVIDDDRLKTFIDANSAVLGAMFRMLYLYAADIREDHFPDTAALDAAQRWGMIYLNRNINPAISGVYTVSFTTDADVTFRAGLSFVSSRGFTYILDSEVESVSPTTTFNVRAVEGGTDSRLIVNDTITINEPLAGSSQEGTVTAVVTEPATGETLEQYRQDQLDAIRKTPQGGSRTDYRLWASEVQGVKKVYPYVANAAAGTVNVYVEANKDDSIDDFATPSGILVLQVQALINTRKPVQTNVAGLAITPHNVNITITGLVDQSTSVKNLIESTVENYLETIRPFIDGDDLISEKNDILYLASVQAQIADAIGAANPFNEMSMTVNGISTIKRVFEQGFIPKLNVITYA